MNTTGEQSCLTLTPGLMPHSTEEMGVAKQQLASLVAVILHYLN
jgi:hypothetical protein